MPPVYLNWLREIDIMKRGSEIYIERGREREGEKERNVERGIWVGDM